MNLLSAPALEDLEEALFHLPDTTEVLVFESGHPSVFAAGADMAEMATFSSRDAIPFSARGQGVFARIEGMPMVTAALVDGDCFGGALDLVMAFDYRWASTRARFSHPGARIGIVTGFGGTSRWRRILGNAVARKLFLENAVLSSSEAETCGLVDRVIDDVRRATDGDLLLLDARSPEEIEMVKALSAQSRPSAATLLGLARRLASVYALSANR
jgi:enoyl-CoA hydratase